MATVARLDVKIGADLSGFSSQMGKLQSQMKNVGTSLQSVGKKMSLAVTVPILGIGGAAIKAASDVEEMQSKFNTVFKTVGGSVSRELGTFASAVGRSRYELQGMAAQLGDIFKPLGFTEEQAGRLSVQMTKLAVDLGSFNNMPMSEALDRLQGTLVGSHENALRFGVVINENVLKQELMRMGADKLTGSQKEQAKVQARLNLLLAGTADAQGDALRTSGSFANQMEGLKNALRDTGAELGQVLLPFATELVGKLRGWVDVVKNLSPEMRRMAIIVAGVAAAAGPLIFSLGGIASGFSAILRVISLTMGMFNPYVAGIAAVAAIAIGVYRNFDKVRETLSAVSNRIQVEFSPAIEAIGGVLTAMKETAETAFAVLLDWWVDNKDMVIEKIGVMFVAVSGAVSAAIVAVGTIIELGLNATKNFWALYGVDIMGIMGLAFTVLINGVTAYFENLKNVIQLGLAILDPRVTSWSDIWESMKGIVDTNYTLIKDNTDAFLQAVKDKLDTNSGADLAEEVVGTESGGFKSIMDGILASALGSFGSFSTGVFDKLNQPAGASNAIDDLIAKFGNAKGAIEGLEKLDPDFTLLAEAIGGDGEKSLVSVADAAKESVDALMLSIPTELEMPEWDIEALTDVEVSGWLTFKDALAGVANKAWHIGFNLTEIRGALDVLYNGKLPDWMNGFFRVAQDVANVFSGMDALAQLMDRQIWVDFYNDLKNILGVVIDIVVEIGKWILAQLSLNTAQGAGSLATGTAGVPAVIGATGPQTGSSATGGNGSGADAAGLLAVATVFFETGRRLLAPGTTLEDRGLTIEQFQQMLLETQGGRGFLGGVDLGATGLDWSYATGGISGRMAGGQTINVNLDGQTIAQATMPYWSQELEIYGTNR